MSAPVCEGGEHGDAGTEDRPSTLQGEAIRDLNDEPDNDDDDNDSDDNDDEYLSGTVCRSE